MRRLRFVHCYSLVSLVERLGALDTMLDRDVDALPVSAYFCDFCLYDAEVRHASLHSPRLRE